jgi:hypothetical protein
VTRYLSVDSVVEINRVHCGLGAGVRDLGIVQAAVARPRQSAFGVDGEEGRDAYGIVGPWYTEIARDLRAGEHVDRFEAARRLVIERIAKIKEFLPRADVEAIEAMPDTAEGLQQRWYRVEQSLGKSVPELMRVAFALPGAR